MKILHLSDSHGAHRRLPLLPSADIVVHSGDFTMTGSEAETLDFLQWFCDLNFPHKIFICGNHELCLYDGKIEGLDSNVHYLRNSEVVIDGVKFYGVPMFYEDSVFGTEFKYYEKIPSNVDVLITHSPAYGILDYDDGVNYGSKELLTKLSQLNLKAHLFGHTHAQHGIKKIRATIFSNGALMNEDYSNLSNPNIIEI